MPPPDLHGVGRHVHGVGDLIPGQQPSRSESLISGPELVVTSDVLHDTGSKWPSSARHVSACVQYLRDTVIGVLVEELIDQDHDLGASLTELPGVQCAV